MDKRYQVFVSSTYEDLRQERHAVMMALLQMDAIPAGMELFPAADDNAWTLISEVIQECDYYAVIVAGKYGSVDQNGISYTEREYDLAVEMDKPVMPFLYKDIGDLKDKQTESTKEQREALERFRNKIKDEKLVKFWTSPDELAGQVALSLAHMQKTHPAVGWVRGDTVANTEAIAEIGQLRERIRELEEELEEAESKPPPGTENFEHGEDSFDALVKIQLRMTGSYRPAGRYQSLHVSIGTTWNELLFIGGPKLLDECGERVLRRHLTSELIQWHYGRVQGQIESWVAENFDSDSVGFRLLDEHQMDENDFGQIIVQFKALGIIEKSSRQRSVKDRETYWGLTPYGEGQLVRLRARKRQEPNDQDGA